MSKLNIRELTKKFREGKKLTYEEQDRLSFTRAGEKRAFLRTVKKTVDTIELVGQSDYPVVVNKAVREILRLARRTTLAFCDVRTIDSLSLKEKLEGSYLTFPEPWHVSAWAIDNGSITVGCTTIPWKEVDMIGKKLSLWD